MSLDFRDAEYWAYIKEHQEEKLNKQRLFNLTKGKGIKGLPKKDIELTESLAEQKKRNT